MKKFDIIAQVTVENRFAAEQKEGESWAEAVLRQIKNLSPEACKALVTSGELSTFHLGTSQNDIVYLIVSDRLSPDDDSEFLDDIDAQINKDMSAEEIADIIAEELSSNTWHSFEPEDCIHDAEKILYLLHQ